MVRKLLICALIGYWLLLASLTHAPRLPPTGPRMGDKTAHLLAYAILASLLFLTLWTLRPRMRWLPLLALCIPLAYGAIDELTQPLSGRDCEFADWVADAVGAVAAVGILTIIRLFAMRRAGDRTVIAAPAPDVTR